MAPGLEEPSLRNNTETERSRSVTVCYLHFMFKAFFILAGDYIKSVESAIMSFAQFIFEPMERVHILLLLMGLVC